MASFTRWLVLSLLLSMLVAVIFCSATARAADDEDEDIPRGSAAGSTPEDPAVNMGDAGHDAEEDADEDDSVGDDSTAGQETGGVAGIFARAFFPKAIGGDKFVAGQDVETLIAFQNGAENPNYMVAFAVAHLTHAADPNYYVQNFSGILYERTAHSGETLTLKYVFQPHESLEPHDYGLVIQAIFQNDDNQTYAATAFNGTITILEPSGIDSQTVMTFLTIAGLAGGAGYYFTKIRGKRSGRSGSGKATKNVAELGTSGTYEPDFVNDSHKKYIEELAKRKASRSGSPTSPTK